MKNFGLIKTIFEDLMVDALVNESKLNKALYNKFVNRLKTNKVMRTQFEVYNLLEEINDDVDKDNLNFYIKECVSLLDGVERGDIIKENLKTFKPILENFPELEFKDYPEKTLHESIAELIFTKKNSKTINSLIKHTNVIKENLTSKQNVKPLIKEEETLIPNSILSKLMVEKFKEKYSSFSQIETVAFMSLIKENSELKEETFKFVLKECIGRVNNKLETEPNLKETLLKVKEKLLTDNFLEENYKTDILKLVDLFNDLE